MITLICDREQPFWERTLSRWDEVRVFPDGVALAYYLHHQGPCGLAVVAVDGADGMNCCAYAKHMRPAVRVLWVSQDPDFAPQSRRMGVEGFLAKPLPRGEPEGILARILGPPKGGG